MSIKLLALLTPSAVLYFGGWLLKEPLMKKGGIDCLCLGLIIIGMAALMSAFI